MTKFVWTLTWLLSLASIAATGYLTYVIINKYNETESDNFWNIMLVAISITRFSKCRIFVFKVLGEDLQAS